LGQASPPWELVALEVKEALTALGEITGEEVGDAVLDHIFPGWEMHREII
jgi:tRNA U34 5-carboxymethylaminomethyl modifying GTPase MnmE/TrmE